MGHNIDLQWLFDLPEATKCPICNNMTSLDELEEYDIDCGSPEAMNGIMTFDLEAGLMYTERPGQQVKSRELSPETGWLRELKHFFGCIEGGKPSDIVTPKSAANSVGLAVAIKQAAATGELQGL